MTQAEWKPLKNAQLSLLRPRWAPVDRQHLELTLGRQDERLGRLKRQLARKVPGGGEGQT